MDATVLFSDLRGFTSFAEARDPEQVIEVLNRYLTAMSDAILDHGGTLVAYMGDGIMAVFGAPVASTDHADRALDAARAMLQRLEEFNAWIRERGHGDGFKMGIGLHSGPVMSGNVGSARRLEYAAIGDTTNTAARLEGMTKGTPYQLFVGEPTRDRLRHAPDELEFVSELEVRGREHGDPRLGPARVAGAGAPTLAACMTRVRAPARRCSCSRSPRPSQAAERRVPQGWLGVVADGPLSAADAGEWDAMVRRRRRVGPRRGPLARAAAVRQAAEVPPADAPRFRDAGGVPTDFTALDAVVAAAAARGLAIAARRPVDARLGRPDAGRHHVAARPIRPTFGRFLAALAGRYGAQGSLWAERPDLPRVPVRAWQIWNEPNLTRYWSEQPFAPLLRAPAAAPPTRRSRAADPGATVVLAGLPNVSWTALRRIYEAGGRGHFDAVALHPYTREAARRAAARPARAPARCASAATGARRSG